MNRKKVQKVFKHVLCNPFTYAWPDISNEETLQIVSVLSRESVSQALTGLKLENKRQKLPEPNTLNFSSESLLLGINTIIKAIEKVSFVVLLKCEANEALLEPLMLLCRYKNIKCVSGNFDVVYDKLKEITGICKLAAFALPIMHSYPQTDTFLNTLVPKPSKKYLKACISSKEILKK
jgi:RNase P subunit Pop3